LRTLKLPFQDTAFIVPGSLNLVKAVLWLKPVAIHAIVWLAYIFYEISILLLLGRPVGYGEVFLSFSLNIALFYAFGLGLYPCFLKQKKWLKFFFYVSLTLVAYTLIKYSFIATLYPLLFNKPSYIITSYVAFFTDVCWRAIYFIILSTGYWFASDLVKSERKRRELEEKKASYELALLQAEKNNRETQLLYLKNQINPHFLFNTLNFFYGQTLRTSQETAEGILLLSNIMRYALKDTETNLKAMLSDEVKHLQNFIAIQQLRFGNRLQVQFNVEGDLSYRMIPPLILLTFVENAFKYGELLEAAHPVVISLAVHDTTLAFGVTNKKKLGPAEPSAGVGIANTRRRLELLYPGKHSLELIDKPHFYTVSLTIQL
jgi:two-component system, LytTR family, sensor kinase